MNTTQDPNALLPASLSASDTAPGSSSSLDHISNALHATLNPRIPNSIRQQALQHLEAVKSQPDAPAAGFALAQDVSQPDAVRYYGLQLLEFAVRYRWDEYTAVQTAQLRAWLGALAAGLREGDAGFLRNKIGQLWVGVAKRCWGGSGHLDEDEEGEEGFDGDDGAMRDDNGQGSNREHNGAAVSSRVWWDMDAQLLALWNKPVEEKGMANKLLVLYVLETLSEEIINGDDEVAELRMEVLGQALNEVMVPVGLYAEHAVTRGARQEVRAGDEGWLARMCAFFALCVKETRLGGSADLIKSMAQCATKSLNAIRPTMSWISLKAAEEVNCVDCFFLPFHTSDRGLQTAAVEVLFALLSRQYNSHWQTTWMRLYQDALRPDRIALIRQAYEQTQAGLSENDEDCTLQKKMSDLLSVLADAVATHPQLLDNSLDLTALYELMLLVLQSKSLAVSIPVLHSWTKQMAVPAERVVDAVLSALGPLLQICSERLLRYESLPEDTDDEIVQFLYNDFDTIPERHAFLGNYRRYCDHVIQSITRSRPIEALTHVLTQMLTMLRDGPYSTERGFSRENYSKTHVNVLKFDALYGVVSSALKGYWAWFNDVSDLSVDEPLHAKAQKDQQAASEMLQEWCYNIVNIQVHDPTIADQVMQMLVSVLRTFKTPPTDFILRVVQHLLDTRLPDDPVNTAYSDAVKSFEAMRVMDLQKIAIAFPNHLLDVYQELEPRVLELSQEHSNEQRPVWGYRAALFLIIHRAVGIEPTTRMTRLQQMLKPIYDAWTDPALGAAVANLQTFYEFLALGNIHEFYKAHGFDQVQDWSAQLLDAEGQARQSLIRERSDQLPLRMTKTMLAATTERLKYGTDEYDDACKLWGNLIPAILPSLLQMVRLSQAFYNLENWSQLPSELQAVVTRTLQDRFWQSGISNESKDEFYARISGSKISYEGFASTVRGTVRVTREQGYHILYLCTKFEEQFYGLSDLAEPLAEALFADAGSLATNHLHATINLTTGLVQRCPPHYRARFLPPILRQFFMSLDAKISSEWETIAQAAKTNRHEKDELSDEMRTESVLRQLTFSMVSFVPFLLEQDRPAVNGDQAHANGNGHASVRPTPSDLVLSDVRILEPLMLFCTHALRMRDTRCCMTICRVFRNIVPLFALPTPPRAASDTGVPTISDEVAAPVREFICNQVFKACIDSLRDPYFVDMRNELAALVAQILFLFVSYTPAPREALLKLDRLEAAQVDKAISNICRAEKERQRRGFVLQLLKQVSDKSIHEAGKIERVLPGAPPSANSSAGKGKAPGVGKKSNPSSRYMEVDQVPMIVNGNETALDAVAGLFDEAS